MKRAHILIVDDDSQLRKLMRAILMDDYTISLAENGREALNLIADQITPDLILLDVKMPEIDGFTFYQHLQSDPEKADIPIIFISGNDSFENEIRALEMGAVDYISKPFHVPAVRNRIKTQLELRAHRIQMEKLVATRTAQLSETIAEVEHKEAHLKGIINMAPIGIGLLRDGVIDQVNLTMAKLTGYSRRQLLGKEFRDLYPQAEHYRRDFKLVSALLKSSTTAVTEVRLKKSCGSLADFSLRFSSLEAGKVHSELIFTAMDISERKRYEEELESRVKKKTQELRAANQLMEREIHERKCSEEALMQSEIELERQRAVLEESNVALKVLIRDADLERREFEERVALNLQELVEPYLNKLRRTTLDLRQQNYISIIEGNIKNIVSPLVKTTVSFSMRLTPAEIQIANLIKQGKASKEIAELLHLSQRTIDKHRSNIRKKLGINNSKVNLKSLLTSDELHRELLPAKTPGSRSEDHPFQDLLNRR
ncbi:MAG: response regulator [Desulfuromonadales bacterium]|nr:response regulator [Desulfuromonadales bacterium]MBN2792330.1 response regulator [Desulfuromonadales bacterium]